MSHLEPDAPPRPNGFEHRHYHPRGAFWKEEKKNWRIRIMRLTVLLAALAFTASSMSAAPLNGLYFGLDNFRGFAEVYWWFQADGRIVRNVIPATQSAAGFESACTKYAASCGRYSLAGNKLTIQYSDGRKEDWTYKPLTGGIQLNYLILTPVGKYPAGATLNGSWDRAFSSTVHSAPGSNVTVTVPQFYAFKPDGTFTYLMVAGVDTDSRVKGASISSAQKTQATGTYQLRDNTLTLVKNGVSEQHVIYPVAGDNLAIDGQVYKKH